MWPSSGKVLKLQERMWRRVTDALSVTTCHKGCPTPSHVEELHPQKERPCHCASTPTAGDFGRAGVARIQTRRWAQVLHNGVPQEEHHVANANEPEVMGGTGGEAGNGRSGSMEVSASSTWGTGSRLSRIIIAPTRRPCSKISTRARVCSSTSGARELRCTRQLLPPSLPPRTPRTLTRGGARSRPLVYPGSAV